MSCILSPALLMQNKDTPFSSEYVKHLNLWSGNVTVGQKIRVWATFTPVGNMFNTGWTGTASKCSSIGFIAHHDDWANTPLSIIHNPAQAYREVGSMCVIEGQGTVSRAVNINIGIYAIINNGWVNGYDNQCFLVHGIVVWVNGNNVYEKGDTETGISFRVGTQNFTPMFRVGSPISGLKHLAYRDRVPTATGSVVDTDYAPMTDDVMTYNSQLTNPGAFAHDVQIWKGIASPLAPHNFKAKISGDSTYFLYLAVWPKITVTLNITKDALGYLFFGVTAVRADVVIPSPNVAINVYVGEIDTVTGRFQQDRNVYIPLNTVIAHSNQGCREFIRDISSFPQGSHSYNAIQSRYRPVIYARPKVTSSMFIDGWDSSIFAYVPTTAGTHDVTLHPVNPDNPRGVLAYLA